MRVLMLGWEFPPHITGGLGTACEGLSRGLAEEGEQVTFLVPRRFGDEPICPNLEVHAAHEFGRGAAASRRAFDAEPRTGGATPGDLQSTSGLTDSDETTIRTVPIDSLLRPYDRPGTYEERLRAARLAAGIITGTEPTGPETDADDDREPGFHHYGKDLYAEVERFAQLCARGSVAIDFDVVHAHDWMTYPAGLAIRARTGKPLVVHVHSIERDRSGPFSNPDIRAVEGAGIRAADRVIAVSHYTRSCIIEEYGVAPERVDVVHNGITRAQRLEQYHIEPTDPPGTRTVLFLGRVTSQKGPEFFVRAAEKVLSRMPHVRFVLAGDGDLLPAMRAEVSRRGLDPAFRFPGFLRGRELERALTLADVYVMPSVSEPFGITPLEAMAYDTPVVVSRQSGVSEVLRHVFKVDYWDVDRMAGQIVALLQHPELRSEMVRMAARELLSLHWHDAARKVASVYRRVARPPAPLSPVAIGGVA